MHADRPIYLDAEGLEGVMGFGIALLASAGFGEHVKKEVIHY